MPAGSDPNTALAVAVDNRSADMAALIHMLKGSPAGQIALRNPLADEAAARAAFEANQPLRLAVGHGWGRAFPQDSKFAIIFEHETNCWRVFSEQLKVQGDPSKGRVLREYNWKADNTAVLDFQPGDGSEIAP